MSGLSEKALFAAEQILKRPLNDGEQLEIYRIADILGMKDVQSFLHLLLVFKLHEETMDEKFSRMVLLEEKIQDTLETCVERTFSDGATRIGANLTATIAEEARKSLTSYGEYHLLRGRTIEVCFICLIAPLAYWLGTNGVLDKASPGGAFETFLLLPGGWCVFFCGVTYTFLWVGDHWERIKRTKLHKMLLSLQLFLLLVLSLSLL